MTSGETDLHYLELLDLARQLRNRHITSTEITGALLERISVLDDNLGSYAHIFTDEAMKAAVAADAEFSRGWDRGPLHGIPLGVKDLFWTKNQPTAGGTAIHRDFRPSEDATAVARIKAAGAIILGKHQMTEGAYSDYHPTVVPPKNPWNEDYWAGISSSGSAVATAAGLCYGAIGSDTGGSIRWPCSATGLTGIKPTWGRISRFGVFELAASLDHVGILARSAADVGVLLGVVAGSDPSDSTALLAPVPDYLATLDVRDLRIGIDRAWNGEDVDNDVLESVGGAVDVFRDLGAEIICVRTPDVRQGVRDWSSACAVEASVAHSETYPARSSEYGPIFSAFLDKGRKTAAAGFQNMLLRRMDLCGRFAAVLKDVDLLLTPVQPFAPLTLDAMQNFGACPDLIFKLQRFTVPFNLTGSPTITMPGGLTKGGLPVGFQLVANHLCEAKLIQAGIAFQAVTRWHRFHPAL